MLECIVALITALITAIVGIYHWRYYPEQYSEIPWREWGKAQGGAFGSGMGLICVFIFSLTLFALYLNIAFGIAFCFLILFVDYKILKKIDVNKRAKK